MIYGDILASVFSFISYSLLIILILGDGNGSLYPGVLPPRFSSYFCVDTTTHSAIRHTERALIPLLVFRLTIL